MSIARFVYANLVFVPLLVAAAYVFYESLPVIAVPLVVGYLTFVFLVSLAWGLSKLSMALES
ncbi:hypothetical protein CHINAEXTREME_18860 [Halobiforma lacisalsi AJ5]|uniref:Uncharacterized protein n=2 Tax=Natronobacterium TaxID=2256 RepID=M0LVK7_NATLA|nr:MULTISPECIES: hypothetical protein [Halobiforma]APW99704.1 hypothetical protein CHINAEXTREME_18860 [Halobiforma lacisalsi AJ5]EMA36125.1 hypothetical protein C445_04688 [Halobiforma lacisalsi AJ5]SFC10879.1 hypothetical protein SAMN05444422_104313 [Halobiforma haloterrestris]